MTEALAAAGAAHRSPCPDPLIWRNPHAADPLLLVEREWLVTNGLGGYASGTVSGICTRRYHGLLIAALPAPLGRTVMLNHISEELRLADGRVVYLSGRARADGTVDLESAAELTEFRIENGQPVWVYRVGPHSVEKRLLMPNRQNTTHIHYRVVAGEGRVRLRIRPSVHFRPHEASVGGRVGGYDVHCLPAGIEIPAAGFPPLRMQLVDAPGAFVYDGGRCRDIFYRMEHARGYESRGSLWNPGYFRADLALGQQCAFIASTEHWDAVRLIPPAEALRTEEQREARLLELADPRARRGIGARLVMAADQFIIAPATRVADSLRLSAAGDEARTVIAGYHWFTDWGRDTMISLEGLTLVTGRHAEAGYILRNFAQHVRDGLIPNLFPEGENEGLYHTADATLWFFHALDRYVEATGDRQTLRQLLPTLAAIVEHHRQGTRFGIGVDPADGLIRQGQAGYQLTWMDAKVGDWVVTPRRGKAVEINALWYNALQLMEAWAGQADGGLAPEPYAAMAARVRDSFNARFWNPATEALFDVVDGEGGDDGSIRPNQVFAISLPHPVLDRSRWRPVVELLTRRLLTPMGLRSLAPGEKDYKPRYDGDLRARDAAYHQGTVWAWLIGPFVDAWLKVYPADAAAARDFLTGFEAHLGEACLGSISEIFDAEAPYTARGCVAQAWSVAEVLRAWVKTHPAG